MRDEIWAEDCGLGPPFEAIEPEALTTPLVFNSPHSGSKYPRRFLEISRLDPLTLRRSEDAFVDELFLRCVALGAPLLRAHFPRAYLDVNREPYELDPRMFEGRLPDFANTRSLRVAAGLGSIPRVVGEAQPIYRQPISVAAGLSRIEALHHPYHAELAALIERARRNFGLAILIDGHSMPSASPEVSGADIVLGDRYGSSAAGWIVDALETSLSAAGLAVRRNKPYAGGYITETYGQPTAGRHAVQIEINRALYMDERAIRKFPASEALAEALLAAAAALAASANGREGLRLAAE
jgi:N-formylglutamate amidohydrolase